MTTTVPTSDSRPTRPLRSALTRPRAGSSAFDTRPWWQPRPEELVDAAAVIALAALAGFGLTTVYDGYGVVAVTVVGALVGTVAAWVVAAAGLSPLPALGVIILAAVAGAGVAVPDSSLAVVFPGPQTPTAFADGLVRAWRDLLTTARPVGLSGGLGVVPYVLGFACGTAATLLARLTRAPLLPAAPGLAVLAGSIVFGWFTPASVLVQGGGFLVVSMAWASWRANRSLGTTTDGIYWPRVMGAAAMLAVLVPTGLLVGPHLPLVGSDRTVLRRDIVPPSVEPDFGSPLASLRRYRTDTTERKVSDKTFLRVTGLPKGARIRLATMDTYDGVVWVVSNNGRQGSGVFSRVGARVDPAPAGRRAAIGITVEEYSGFWVPLVGDLVEIGFSGPSAAALTKGFRFNATTGTAGTMHELRSSDRYRLEVALPPSDLKGIENAQVGATFTAYDPAIGERLNELVRPIEGKIPTTGSPYERAQALAKYLSSDEWYFSDGGPEAVGPAAVPAGHNILRLNQLMTQRVGNAEQYAAAMALIAHRMGLPARVVMGFRPKRHGNVEIKGSDATAWVEINFQGYGWVPFDPTPPEDNTPQPPPPPPEQTDRSQQPQPPPTYLEPPAPVPPLSRNTTEPEDDQVDEPLSLSVSPWVLKVARYVGLPLLVLGLILGTIQMIKSMRRRRRRSRGSPAERLNGAWLEAVDRLRDLGFQPDFGATRWEVSVAASHALGWTTGPAFATAVDAAMFGPAEPGEDSVRDAWTELHEQVRGLYRPLPLRARLKARFSLASLRRNRPRNRSVTMAVVSGA